MSAVPPSYVDLVHTYRHLYRALLHAVQFSKPARYTLRDKLREAFRKEHPSTFDKEKISRTLEFVKFAGAERGIENRILKNILFVARERQKKIQIEWPQRRKDQLPIQAELRKNALTHYDMTLAMLNETMGLCLR